MYGCCSGWWLYRFKIAGTVDATSVQMVPDLSERSCQFEIEFLSAQVPSLKCMPIGPLSLSRHVGDIRNEFPVKQWQGFNGGRKDLAPIKKNHEDIYPLECKEYLDRFTGFLTRRTIEVAKPLLTEWRPSCEQ